MVMDSFAAISDPIRRRLLEVLLEGPRPVKELVELFPISQPAVSRHLRVLRSAGVVESFQLEDDARLRLYRLRPEPLDGVRDWLQLFWQNKLDGFAAHARERA
jgi:DNA-binding transcriptional ArsR family regulator